MSGCICLILVVLHPLMGFGGNTIQAIFAFKTITKGGGFAQCT